MEYPNFKSRQKPAFYTILVFVMSFLLGALPANAITEGPYLTLTGSIDMFEDMTLTNIDSGLGGVQSNMGREIGLGFNHSIGYQFRNSFSTELEFSYKGGDFTPGKESSGGLDGDMTTKSFLINGIYSFNIREFYTPYIGYGIGLASHEATNNNAKGDRSDGTLAYQLKMGVDMEFFRKLSLLLGYRYFTTDNPDFTGFFTAESSSHSIEAGVKFHF